ncbi:MAG: BBP7 family outer membrane beta-barrel protein [Gemmataceae bacterium]
MPAPVPPSPAGASCGPNGCGTGSTSTGSCATCTTGCTTAPSCGCGPCGPNGPCGPYGRAWVSVEYLLWTTKGMNAPPLATASGNPNRLDPLTGRPAAGTLVDPATVILNSDKYNDDWRSGLRVRAGFWLDECQTCGLEGSYFFLGNGNDGESFNCFNGAGVFRPFYNSAPVAAGSLIAAINPAAIGTPIGPDAELVCFPNRLNGTVSIGTQTKFQGFDANFRKNLFCDCNSRLDLLAGYRYLRLQDSLQITENLQVIGLDPNLVDQLPVGTTFVVQDTFETTNTFNGGQVGLASEWRNGRLFFGARGLVAIGNTNKEINVTGFTRVTQPGAAPQTFVGGLLAQRTNIGSRTYNDFAVVPEATLTVGYAITDGLRAFVSYNFLYWSNVSRAGDQVDLTVDGRQINQAPDAFLATRPAPLKNNSDFWAQGISFGLELRY